MELQHPLAVVTPTLDGQVLTVLASAEAWFTTGQLHRIIGDHSQDGIRRTVRRLVRQGIVDHEAAGRTDRYRFNAEHLAAPGVKALIDQRNELLRRIEQTIGGWARPPVYAALFGSASRGQMRPDSDIDLFLVRPDDVDDAIWDAEIARLQEQVTRWTGNDARTMVMSDQAIDDGAGTDPLLESVIRDGLTVYGPSTWLRRRILIKRAGHGTANH
jgi:predicted nucleotidyltransferase